MAMNLEQIRRVADRVAKSQHLEVVDIQFAGGGKQRVLRISIEKDGVERARLAAGYDSAAADEVSGLPGHQGDRPVALDQLAWVTHEDCERFSRDFGALLDVEELAPASTYTLEVSSPGLDRELKSPADYQRFLESTVRVQTFDPVEGSRHWQGRLSGVETDRIVLNLAAIDRRSRKKGVALAEKSIGVAFSNIEKANLVPEF